MEAGVNDITSSELLCPTKGSSALRLCTMLPCPCCFQCVRVNLRTEKVLLLQGRYYATLREPGCYCVNMQCDGVSVQSASTAMRSDDLNNLTVVDAQGRPLVVSAVVNWRVRETCTALTAVADYRQFLLNQGEVVLKQLCALSVSVL